MTYERYAQLLQAKFALVRGLHICQPGEKPLIWRNIAEIDKDLAGAPREFLREYAGRNELVG